MQYSEPFFQDAALKLVSLFLGGKMMINDLGHDFLVYLWGHRMMIEHLTDKGIALDSLVCFLGKGCL